MANGELTNILVSTDVTRYLEFKQIAGSYVQTGAGTRANVAKVPSDAGEALRSPLMGLFEKRRAKKFLEYVGGYKEDDSATHQGMPTRTAIPLHGGNYLDTSPGMNLSATTMKEVYDKFGLEASTRDFIGHSMALYTTDDYLLTKGMALDAVQRIRLYVNSMARYGKSPYIYPLYGLGELPQGFARLSAIYGGTYMLNTDIDEITYDGRRVSGIKATMHERGDEDKSMKFETKTKKIIADPSYFPGKVQVVGHLLKAICILNHPIASTDNSDSLQLIIPQSQVGRKHGTFPSKSETDFTRMEKANVDLPRAHKQTSTSPSSPPPTTSAPRATTSPSSPPSPRPAPTTTSSSQQASNASARSKRSLWAPPSRCTSLWRAATRMASTSAGVTMLQVISRLRLVCLLQLCLCICPFLDFPLQGCASQAIRKLTMTFPADDVRDIYRRVEGKELVVEVRSQDREALAAE